MSLKPTTTLQKFSNKSHSFNFNNNLVASKRQLCATSIQGLLTSVRNCKNSSKIILIGDEFTRTPQRYKSAPSFVNPCTVDARELIGLDGLMYLLNSEFLYLQPI